MYTIGIKRKLFGFKKIKVINHKMEVDVKVTTYDGREVIAQIPPRMALTLPDNSILLISNICEKDWKIYSDFRDFSMKEAQKWQELAAKNSTAQQPT